MCINFVISVVSLFGVEGGTVVLIRPVPGFYLPFTFGITIKMEMFQYFFICIRFRFKLV